MEVGINIKRGYLDRDEDVSGTSGTGSVAEFVISSDGRVAIFWPVGIGQFPSLQAAIDVHGHQGKTRFVILDDPDAPTVEHCIKCHNCSCNEVHDCGAHKSGCPGCLAGVS